MWKVIVAALLSFLIGTGVGCASGWNMASGFMELGFDNLIAECEVQFGVPCALTVYPIPEEEQEQRYDGTAL